MGFSDMLDVNIIKGEIADIEALKTVDFAALGKVFYEQVKNTDMSTLPEQAKSIVAAINNKNSQIEEKNKQVEAINLVLLQRQKEREAQASAANINAAQPVMAFCVNCGAKLEPGMLFCTNCGSRIQQAAAPAQPSYQPAPQNEQQPITYNYNGFNNQE